MITLSELVCAARGIDPPTGRGEGNCIFCGQYTENGHQAKMKDSFLMPGFKHGDMR